MVVVAAIRSVLVAEEHSEDEHRGHSHRELAPEIDGKEEFHHFHFSNLETPVLHSFGVEPAFTGRDLFFTYRYRDTGGGVNEQEIETQLEWAFNHRAGIILEIPRVFANTPGQAGRDGFGDLIIIPRLNVIERDRFFLTTELSILAPTGTNGFGGNTTVAPGIAAWCDLGDWWTLNTQLAAEHNFTNDSNAFVFGFGVMKTLGSPADLSKDESGHTSTIGLFTLLMEATGRVGVSGQNDGVFELEGTLGLLYGVGDAMDFWAGYEFPVSTPRQYNGGIVVGFIKHL